MPCLPESTETRVLRMERIVVALVRRGQNQELLWRCLSGQTARLGGRSLVTVPDAGGRRLGMEGWRMGCSNA